VLTILQGIYLQRLIMFLGSLNLPQMRFWTFGQFWTFWTVKTSFGHCPVQNPIGRPKRNPANWFSQMTFETGRKVCFQRFQ
jgi:hypothetical protein